MSGRPKIYAYADVGRFGLGHGMLAWARCVVWCAQSGATLLPPRWLRARIGPLLRNERDKRFYFKLFRNATRISAARRIALLGTRQKIAADVAVDMPQTEMPDGAVILFTNVNSGNEARYFHQVIGQQDIVRTALIAMTRPRYRPATIPYRHIAIHVRGGDFGMPANVGKLTQGATNQRLPVSWFGEMLAGFRRRLGHDAPAIIYSDCSDEEIAPLLAMPNVARSRHRESVTDMLAMSGADVQISSGSGFSRWGAYLGSVPRICFPGQRHIRIFGDQTNPVDLEPEAMDATELSDDFVSLCNNRLIAPMNQQDNQP